MPKPVLSLMALFGIKDHVRLALRGVLPTANASLAISEPFPTALALKTTQPTMVIKQKGFFSFIE